jgi:hypothetical protein
MNVIEQAPLHGTQADRQKSGRFDHQKKETPSRRGPDTQMEQTHSLSA